MRRRTFVRPEAQSDIREAASWYEDREAGLGLRFLREVRASLERIADDRLTFPIIEQDVRRALLHKFRYSIYFVNEGKLSRSLPCFINIADRTLGNLVGFRPTVREGVIVRVSGQLTVAHRLKRWDSWIIFEMSARFSGRQIQPSISRT
jgi:plasmid stabilization system protein ParE